MYFFHKKGVGPFVKGDVGIGKLYLYHPTNETHYGLSSRFGVGTTVYGERFKFVAAIERTGLPRVSYWYLSTGIIFQSK